MGWKTPSCCNLNYNIANKCSVNEVALEAERKILESKEVSLVVERFKKVLLPSCVVTFVQCHLSIEQKPENHFYGNTMGVKERIDIDILFNLESIHPDVYGFELKFIDQRLERFRPDINFMDFKKAHEFMNECSKLEMNSERLIEILN
jgi:hypothetical protein